MPKKLAQLVKDMGAITTGFEKQMSVLSRISLQLPDHDRDILQNSQSKLRRRIEELQRTDKKTFRRVGDALYNADVHKLTLDFDLHKGKLRLLFKDYRAARAELDNIVTSTEALLTRTDAIIVDKQNQWFSSGSVDAIKNIRTQLASSCAKMKQTVADLGKGFPAWKGEGDALDTGTKFMNVAALNQKWDAPEINHFINYFQKLTFAKEKKRAQQLTADLRKTLGDTEKIAKSNPDV